VPEQSGGADLPERDVGRPVQPHPGIIAQTQNSGGTRQGQRRSDCRGKRLSRNSVVPADTDSAVRETGSSARRLKSEFQSHGDSIPDGKKQRDQLPGSGYHFVEAAHAEGRSGGGILLNHAAVPEGVVRYEQPV
jgi:hypothetical protein